MAQSTGNTGDTANTGKRVFFLYPHSVIEENLVNLLFERGFEIYLVNDHRSLRKLLPRYPDSILFINIDERLQEPEWEQYIRGIMEDKDTGSVQIGILTYNEDEELSRKYLMDLMITGGYVQLKLGVKESSRIILNTLVANEARGKRQYIRANCANRQATFNIEVSDNIYEGEILDISSAGMACRFTQDPDLAPQTPVGKIQLKLQRRLVMVGGIIAGARSPSGGEAETGQRVYVVMFTDYISQDAKNRIIRYVYSVLEAQLQRELNEVAGK
ncbi:MAG: PilZ domain-containing protein [Spirochaetales bacterium]|nr:PilZ domain-containing protein [Spirochaetales bacterium]MCF7938894.1 PilZ domain-containing protein [Spirochaetales bacterium]